MRDIANAVAKQEDLDMKMVPVEQEWHKSGRQCPIGSIPIMRTNPTVFNLTGFFPPLHVANTTPTDTAGAASRTEVSLGLTFCLLYTIEWNSADFIIGF
jgi:hypothetical protein